MSWITRFLDITKAFVRVTYVYLLTESLPFGIGAPPRLASFLSKLAPASCADQWTWISACACHKRSQSEQYSGRSFIYYIYDVTVNATNQAKSFLFAGDIQIIEAKIRTFLGRWLPCTAARSKCDNKLCVKTKTKSYQEHAQIEAE